MFFNEDLTSLKFCGQLQVFLVIAAPMHVKIPHLPITNNCHSFSAGVGIPNMFEEDSVCLTTFGAPTRIRKGQSGVAGFLFRKLT